jgi:hypothetical protein
MNSARCVMRLQHSANSSALYEQGQPGLPFFIPATTAGLIGDTAKLLVYS